MASEHTRRQMATRARAGGIGIQEFLIAEERGLSALHKESPQEAISSTMNEEGRRLDDFLWSVVLAAERILNTGVLEQLIPEASYLGSPIARPVSKLRPDDDYFKVLFKKGRSKQVWEVPGFSWDLVIPHRGNCAAIELEGAVYLPYRREQPPEFQLSFEVNYDDTLNAFRWLLSEWRRPVGQLLRGVPNLELQGNGITIDGPKGRRTKDPATRLAYHLAQITNPEVEPTYFSLCVSFGPEDTDDDVVMACAVFLCFFDSVYRLTCERVDPDRLLRHYQTLAPYIRKAPFRATMIFPKVVSRWPSRKEADAID